VIRDWLIIATVIACLWGLWLLLQFTFDAIEQYHAAWREAASKQDGEASEAAEGTGSSDW
jgi:hypothetical protein